MPDNPGRRFRLRTDGDYEKLGIKPPEHLVHQGSESVRPDNHGHSWIHIDGPWLECREGEGYNHGIPFDHLNKKLVGTSPEGAPLLQDIVLANQAESDAFLAENVDTDG